MKTYSRKKGNFLTLTKKTSLEIRENRIRVKGGKKILENLKKKKKSQIQGIKTKDITQFELRYSLKDWMKRA